MENPDRISRGIRQLRLDGDEVASPLVHFAGGPSTKHEVHIVLGDRIAKPPPPPAERPPVNVVTSVS